MISLKIEEKNMNDWFRKENLTGKSARLALTLVMLIGALFAAGPVQVANAAAPLCVNEGGSDGCYSTIQAAITDASSGDIINIAAGTYSESPVTINKAVTINGANVGKAGSDLDRVAESRIVDTKLTITAPGVVIDGVEIHQTNNTADAVMVQAAATVKNSVVKRFGVSTGTIARGITTAVGTTGFSITDNLFTGDTSGSLFGSHKTWNSGIYLNGGSGSITGNVFENNRTAINADDLNAGITISGNTFRNNGTFLAFGGTTPTNGQFTIAGNEFSIDWLNPTTSLPSTLFNNSNVAAAFRINAIDNTFGSVPTSSLTDAQKYAIEARMFHRGRSSRNGVIDYIANQQIVVPGLTTIQSAINAATAGDTVKVAPGTATEEVSVNKQVTLEGANHTVAAGATPGTRGTETTINGGFLVSASGTKIDGFTIQNGRTSGSFKVGVAVATSNVTIEDTIIENVTTPAQSDGISTQTGNNNLTLTNSTIRNNWRGIYLNPGSGHVLTGNYIHNNSGSGVGIGSDGLSNTTLFDNTFSGNSEAWGASAVGANVSAHFNVFDGNTAGINHYGGSVIDATNNWWGSASGPSGVGTGSGDAVSANVLFDPWLGAQTEEIVSDTPVDGESVSLSSGLVVTYSGTGNPTVILAKYVGDPGSVGTFGSAGTYYDINVSGSGAGDSLQIVMDAGGATGNLYYYDGAVWKLVIAHSGSHPSALGPVAPTGGNYVFTLDNVDTQPLLSQLTGTAFTGADEEIGLTPSTTELAAGETLTVDVEAVSLGLYGVDVSLAFDPTYLEVTKVELGGSDGNDLFADTVVVNIQDNGAGTLRFAYAQKSPRVDVTGNSGSPILLATVTFSAKAAGLGTLHIESAQFTDINGYEAIPGIIEGDATPVELTINPSPTVYAAVALQGRNDHAGLQLEVKPSSTGNVLYNTIVASGRLTIENVPAGTYTARVSAPKYLAAAQEFTVTASVETYDLNDPSGIPGNVTLTLRGGDINADDQINIQDLVLIGVNFGLNTASVDINGDNIVNIQDLAIAAGNYGLKTSVVDASDPTPWQ